jgi:tRNA(fMet)-specific endonuclease VapC
MSSAGPVVVDTDVFSRVVMGSPTGEYSRFQPLLQGRPLILAAQTVAEVRAGALLRNWGRQRVSEMEEKIDRVGVVPVGDAVCRCWAELKASCVTDGHALGEKIHDSDRWIAATAMYLGVPLTSNDGIFDQVAGLDVLG